jgi:nucleotide-binding universal stress UspA family protein
MTETSATPFIVVGVDGSDSAIDALRWAAGQAKLTGATLKVLTAWQLPMAYGAPLGGLGDYDAELAETVTKAGVTLPVTTEVIQGTSAARLVEASDGAQLIVVGRRGHGELVGAILGSVSAYVVAHAHCPVVVVHHSDQH